MYMKEKIALTSNIILIGIIWIYTGTVFIFTNLIKTLERSKFLLSYEFNLNSIISISAIIIGVFFILGKRWALYAVFALSSILIASSWVLSTSMVVYGISDIIRFQTPGSCIRLAFGVIVFFSSFPFILVIASLNNNKIKDCFYKRSTENCNRSRLSSALYLKMYSKQKTVKDRHPAIFFTVVLLFCLVGFSSASYVVLNIDKILHWEENVDFGEYSLSVRDWGKGKPTVIIEGGLNQPKHKYFLLSLFSSNITRVIAYDHAGVGDSTNSHNPRTLPYYVKELRNLIKKKNLHPPFILVGHSSGGHIIRHYTYLYPEDVAGLILIDSPPENWFKYIRENWSHEEITHYFKWWYPDHPDFTKIETLEKLAYEKNCDLLHGEKIPKNIPVLMFTGNNVRHFRKDEAGKKADFKAWAEMQHSLIEGLDDAEQIVDPQTGHYPFKDKPFMVVDEINKFIKKIKDREKGDDNK